MSRLGPAPRRTPRITHEVLDQVFDSQMRLANRAAANRARPPQKP